MRAENLAIIVDGEGVLSTLAPSKTVSGVAASTEQNDARGAMRLSLTKRRLDTELLGSPCPGARPLVTRSNVISCLASRRDH